MKTIIVDLDNCISDDGWRRSKIVREETNVFLKYRSYHEQCHMDALCNRHILEQGHYVAILTGRPRLFMSQTINWLVDNSVKFDHLIMRNQYDYSYSTDLKRKMLGWLINHYDVRKEDIVCAYDDRQ